MQGSEGEREEEEEVMAGYQEMEMEIVHDQVFETSS